MHEETAPDIVVLHHLTNDIKTKRPEMPITETETIICENKNMLLRHGNFLERGYISPTIDGVAMLARSIRK